MHANNTVVNYLTRLLIKSTAMTYLELCREYALNSP